MIFLFEGLKYLNISVMFKRNNGYKYQFIFSLEGGLGEFCGKVVSSNDQGIIQTCF